MVARKRGEMITHFFGSKNYLWLKKYNIVVIIFSFYFEGKMNHLVPLCVHERKFALKNMKQKSCKIFNLLQVTND
jgi:hypothetical protein